MMRMLNNNTKNVMATIVGYFISFAITFFLTPYIVDNIGTEGNGYIQLANNLTNYIGVFTIAINSVVGRFVSIQLYNNNDEEANNYFNSALLANSFIVIILFIPVTIAIVKVEEWLEITASLVQDVKILFLIIFLNFFVTIISSIFSIGVFFENKLYLSSLRSAESSILKAIILVALFSIFPTKLYFVGIANLISQLYCVGFGIYYTRNFTSALVVKKIYFKISYTKKLFKSGMWNSINELSAILNNGLDLIICNAWIGEKEMGILAVSKSIPVVISTIISTVAGVFSPTITKCYAQNDVDNVIEKVVSSTKMMSFLMTVPIAGFIVYGGAFYELWVPGEDSESLIKLSILILLPSIINCSVGIIYHLLIILDKLKLQSLVSFSGSLLSVVIVIFLLEKTKIGVYAVAGVSSFVTIFMYVFFTLWYAAKCLCQKWYLFYKPVMYSVFCLALNCIYGYWINKILHINSWSKLILGAIILIILGYSSNVIFMFNRKEKKLLFKYLKKDKHNNSII